MSSVKEVLSKGVILCDDTERCGMKHNASNHQMNHNTMHQIIKCILLCFSFLNDTRSGVQDLYLYLSGDWLRYIYGRAAI